MNGFLSSRALRAGALGAALFLTTITSFAWDYEGHRWVNQLALASLPTNFPAFVRTPEARERIAFLAGEADRWRNNPDLSIKHFNGPDHYIDIDDLPDYGLSATNLPHLRYVFISELAAARAKHPEKFAPIEKNDDQTKQLVGLLPWAITENYGKLKSGFSYLKTFEEHGTPEEIANAQQNILYIMGVMGHYVGDSVQPLHTTRHYNGWVGENPKGYTTWERFHSWIDGGFINISGLKLDDMLPKIKPAVPLWPAEQKTKREIFPEVMAFIVEQNKMVEVTYQMDKQRKFRKEEDHADGREFLSGQFLKGGAFLGAIWLTAWEQSEPDTYLRGRLLDRKAKQSGKQ